MDANKEALVAAGGDIRNMTVERAQTQSVVAVGNEDKMVLRGFQDNDVTRIEI